MIFGFLTVFSPNKRKTLRVRQEERAILFLDNCSAHPSEKVLISLDGTITVKFLPPNVTAILQPTDQGVIQSIKRVYRKSIQRDFVTQSTFIIQNFSKRIDQSC